MRQLFKVAYTIIGILLAIFIVVKVVNSLKSTKPPPIPNDATTELEKYTAQLKDLEKQMKVSVKMQNLSGESQMLCILNDNNSDPNSYPSIKGQILGIVSKVIKDDLLNIKKTSDTSRAKYTSIINEINDYIKVADNLLSCKDYCFQGEFTGTNNSDSVCTCQYQDPSGKDYYFPILSNSSGKNKIYCWTGECDASQNKQFVGGQDPANPQLNTCNCLNGFSPDGNGNCVSKDDQELTDLTTQIKNDTTQLTTKLSSGFFFCKPIDGKGDGDLIVTDLNNLKNKADELIKDGNISQNTINNYNTAETAAGNAITTYNALTTCDKYCASIAATYDETNNTCICNDKNSTFNKNNKACICNSGYNLCPGPACENCDDKLNSDTDSLNNDFGYIHSTILNDITKIGKITIPGTSIRVNIQPYSTIKNIPINKKDIKQLSANTITDCVKQLYNYMPEGFKTFSFSPDTGSCILYNPQDKKTKPDNITMYGFL
jgi:hypothetical protein